MDAVFRNAVFQACRRNGGPLGLARACSVDPTMVSKMLEREDFSVESEIVRKLLGQIKDQDFPEGWSKQRWQNEYEARLLFTAAGDDEGGSRTTVLDETEDMLLKYYRSLSDIRKNKVLKCLLDQAREQLAVNYADLEIAARMSITTELDDSHFGFEQPSSDPTDEEDA